MNALSYNRWRRTNPLFEDFDRMLSVVNSEAAQSYQWTPSADIVRNGDEFLLELDVPGIKPEAINLSVEDNTLTVEGERASEREQGDVLRSERLTGKFKRSFTLSDAIDQDAIKAEFNNGVLSVTLRKKAELEPRRISVEVK
ncbi:MAG: Hsp20/alpha crystallin family protein [Pseudomonadales bacterium]